MRRVFYIALLGFLLGTLATNRTAASKADSSSTWPAAPQAKPGLVLENLLKAQLEGVEGTEVIVSRVTIPPHTSLPKHWHPGEEFAYILEGSVVLWQEGKDEIVGEKAMS